MRIRIDGPPGQAMQVMCSALAVLQEQAVLYWNNTNKPENQGTAE